MLYHVRQVATAHGAEKKLVFMGLAPPRGEHAGNERTASQLEVDFILGDHEVAVEVKAVEQVAEHHLRGLRAFMEEYRPKRAIVVSLDPRPRKIGAITVMPWKLFLTELWDGGLIS